MAKPYIAVIRHNIKGIKCDTEGCDHRDDGARLEDYLSYINAPCPACGAPLLTTADMIAVIKLMKITSKINNTLNRWLPYFVLKRLDPANKENKVRYNVPLLMNGSGRIEIGDAKKEAI